MAAIVSTDPIDQADEVYIRQNIAITFDVAMDPTTMTAETFIVYDQDFNIIDGIRAYDATNRILSFSPSNPFLVRHDYIVEVVGGEDGVKSLPDAWGDVQELVGNYRFTFTTNDGRFLTPPTVTIPSGVPTDITYPSGVTYSTIFAVRSTTPANAQWGLDPSGVYLDSNGDPTLKICFNKPVRLSSITGSGELCDPHGITIISQDVLQDPFRPIVDLSSTGIWSSVLWQATFTFDNNQVFEPNREITVTIPSTVTATDGSTLAADYSFYFTTELDPLYVGVNHVRLMPVGPMISDIPDDTILRIIHSNSILANWYSAGRPAVIQPFTSNRYTGSEVTVTRPAFTVDPVTGPPEYVKRFVLAKTWYDLLRAKYNNYIDGIMLGGGPGAAKALDDLKITQGGGSIYASTVGPIIESLEGNPKKGIKGEIQDWLDYITGAAKWKPALSFVWGLNDKTKPQGRTNFIGTLPGLNQKA
jgi:hypothetical protein